jgi:putative tryptophan/tyrosine transport system substrate-binding protein
MCFSAIEGGDVKRDVHALLTFAAFLIIATVWMGASWAQNRVWRIGILNVDHYTQDDTRKWRLYRMLSEHGWVVGKNVIFELRDGGGDPRQLAEPAAELVRLKVDMLVPTGPSAVRAAFAATRDIPIVAHDFETDPVAARYAQSYSHPGGNLTGVFLDSPELAGKWIELLNAIVPRLSRVVVLWDPSSALRPLEAVRKAARALGIRAQVLEINTPEDIDKVPPVFRGSPQAMIIVPSPMTYSLSERLAQLARKHRLPATSMAVQFADAGGMLAYGPNEAASFDQLSQLVEKILRGAKPGDLPIERPHKFRVGSQYEDCQ